MREITDMQLCFWDELSKAILKENDRQLWKWGTQKRTPPEWLMYLGEEYGELCEAVAEFEYRKGLQKNIVKEAIQTATLALKIAEMYLVAPCEIPQSPSAERSNG
jgi:NTP pyrophosphatase (non-canonical NTP hydrolase)